MNAQPATRPQLIVFLGTAHDNGGTSILASNLAAAMRKHGHRVEEWYLFSSDGDLPPGARVFYHTKRSPFALLTVFWRVVAALRHERVDVLLGLQPLSNLFVGIAGWIAGVPNRVSAYHGPFWSANQTLMNLDTLVASLGVYTQMVACSNSVAESFRVRSKTYGPIAVVVNGQNAPRMFPQAQARAELGLPADGLILGQIGRLSHQKNQGFSLELMRDLKYELPQAQLVLLGIGPDERAVRAQIAAADIADRVRIVPAVAHDRIGLFYSAVDLVLFPSRYEGLSLAAIEAVHAAVPLLCTDIPSFQELFAASPYLTKTLLLPPTDPAAWRARIRALLTDGALRARVGTELAQLSPAYGFDSMAEQYLQLIGRREAPAAMPLQGAVQSGV
jgi:glycosyltransferase involved in cell wall biosynthesis